MPQILKIHYSDPGVGEGVGGGRVGGWGTVWGGGGGGAWRGPVCMRGQVSMATAGSGDGGGLSLPPSDSWSNGCRARAEVGGR